MIRAAIRLRKAGMAPWSYARSSYRSQGATFSHDAPRLRQNEASMRNQYSTVERSWLSSRPFRRGGARAPPPRRRRPAAAAAPP